MSDTIVTDNSAVIETLQAELKRQEDYYMGDRKRITQLQAELTECNKAWSIQGKLLVKRKEENTELKLDSDESLEIGLNFQRGYEKLQEENKRLREAIEMYDSGHRGGNDSCPAYMANGECNCGYAEIITAMEKS
jgi:hypothetical protein